MKHSTRLGLFLWLTLVPAAHAQERVLELCHFGGDGSQYGLAVTASDLDGDGDDEVVVGAPGFPGQSLSEGGVFFHSTWMMVAGDDADDHLGFAVAGGLNLDGDALGDVLAGAPGDDDNGAECGSVRALSADRVELHTIHGDATGDELGTSVAGIGDLDGDGFDDYVCGAPQGAAGGTGYACVVSGRFATTIRTHVGAASGDHFGRAVIGLPDVDGDGLPDYAVGAPYELGVGRVRVFSGADGSLLRVHDGALPGDEFGWALGSGADVDRDGRDELVVGAPRGGLAPGSAHVFSCADGSELWTLSGADAAGHFGASVDGAGDFDGDGCGDVVVGAPGGSFNGFPNAAGSATVWSGRTGARLLRTGGGWSGAAAGAAVAGVDLDGDGLGEVIVGGAMNNDGYGATPCVLGFARSGRERVRVGQDGSRFGAAVAALGDLDGDGRRELAVGAPFWTNAQGLVTGSVRVETVDGDVIHEFEGDPTAGRLGGGVASAGDVDGDGVDDVLVGAGLRTGFVPGGAFARVYSGATGAVLHHFPGVGTSGFGTALDGGGDVDGDGFADVIVGGARFSSTQGDLDGFLSTGVVRVFSGATGAVLFALDGSSAEGASVAMLDDVDGDGFDDFAFGAPERFLGAPFFTLGEVEVRSGQTGALIGSFTDFYFRMGASLAALDDLDGDGVGDLAVGSWDPQPLWSFGTVHLVSTQTLLELSESQGQTAYTGLTYGYALSSPRDGSGTVIIGTPGTNTSGARAVGEVAVSGAGPPTSLDGHSGWDYFGYSVAGLGDVDGDGFQDVAVGAPTEPGNSFGAQTAQNRVHVVLSDDLWHFNYGPLSPNSSGNGATITARGSGHLSRSDLTLDAAGLPPGKPGVFLLGSQQAQVPYFSGLLLVGGQVGRLGTPLLASPQGTVSTAVDLGSPPASFITPGTQWSFQYLFRDGGGAVNTSDAVLVEFLP